MSLKDLISAQTSGAKLDLPPGEFFGQVTIDQPITIVGKGKSTWIGSRNAPTIRIASEGVVLQNVMVEVTPSPNSVAIEALPGTNPVLQGVTIRGLTTGVRKADIHVSEVPEELPYIPICHDGNPDIIVPPQDRPGPATPPEIPRRDIRKTRPSTARARAQRTAAGQSSASAPKIARPRGWSLFKPIMSLRLWRWFLVVLGVAQAPLLFLLVLGVVSGAQTRNSDMLILCVIIFILLLFLNFLLFVVIPKYTR